MKRQIRTTIAGWLGIALAALLLALAPAPASATSGGCFFPDIVPEIFADDFFDDVDLAFDRDVCQLQCNDFRVGCKQAVKASYKCFVAFVESVISSEKRLCDEIEDKEERKACQQEAKGALDAELESLDEDKEQGRDLCEEIFQECLEDCLITPV